MKETADSLAFFVIKMKKDTKKPVPDDAEIERSYQPCQTFELEEGG